MKKTVFFLILLCLSVLFGFAYGAKTAFFTLTGVSDILYGEEYLYIMDNDGNNYDILKITEHGAAKSKITVPKLSGNWWHSYTHLNEDKDGSVYVYQFKTSMIDDSREAYVYLCNFELNKLELIFELEDQKAIQCQVLDGCLYYARPGKDKGTDFIKKQKTGEESVIYKTDVPYEMMISAYYEPGAGIFWSDCNGKLYKNGREIGKAEDGALEERAHICMGNGAIVYTDIEEQLVKSVNAVTGAKEKLFSASAVKPKEGELAYKDIIPLHYGSEYWSGALDLSGSSRVAAFFDYDGNLTRMFSKIPYTEEIRWANGFGAAVFLFIVGLLLYLLTTFYLKWTHGIVSILTKLFLSLTPVILAGGVFLAGRMLKTFTESSMRSCYDLLYALADTKLSRIPPDDLKKIELLNIPRDKNYQSVFGGTDYSVLPKYLFDKDEKKEPVAIHTYQWVYLLDGGVLKYVVVDDNYYGARVDYYRDREQLQLIQEAMRKKTVVKTQYNDQEGNWIALYVPILDHDGNSIGIMESGMSIGNLQYMSRQQTRKIEGTMAAFIALLTIILISVTRISLYPLSRLRRAVDETASGNYKVTVPIKGKDEVADISSSFNRMTTQINEQVTYIEDCLNGYEKFVPQKVFQILERKDITKLELGDHKEILASVLAADSSSFSEQARTMDAEAIYGAINHQLTVILPEIFSNSGIVDHMLEAGVLSYFPNSAESSLRAAVNICERMNRTSGGETLLPLGIGIARGVVRIGIVGQTERAAVKTMSETVTLAVYLSSLATKYGCRILITGSAAKEIPAFQKRYHVRMIGYLKLKASGGMELLYDAYDGEQPEIFQKKEETKTLFEAGMEAFKKEKFYDARQNFAQVLKLDKEDRAARAYVYRCDTYYQMEDKSGTELYLEYY